jgi:hypothetical protein
MASKLYLPGASFGGRAAFGNLMTLVGSELPRLGGTNQAGDLVSKTIDGFDLNTLWNEFQDTIELQNAERTKIVQLLTFPVTSLIERVAQVSSARFEVASEYGEPRGIRPATGYFNLGYDFEWYDLAARFTWKFLAEAPAAQVKAINAMVLEADNVLIYEKVMQALFGGNVNREANISDQIVPVYGLYNGDGVVPPKYKSATFTGTHTHYMTSGAASIVPSDLDDLYENVTEHGYTRSNGYSFVVIATTREVKAIRGFRIDAGATYDFIPARGDFAQLLPGDQQLIGEQPANTWKGLNVAGAYGPMLIVEEDSFPAGYVVGLATGGPENLGNPVGFRQHENSSLRGLRLVKGASNDYPLIDSFYNRGFGTGIRQRGGAAIMQITASGTYTAPTAY